MGKFSEAIENLADSVGRRNGMLMSVAHLGFREGLSEEEIATAIIEGGGEPRLSVEEVARAIKRASESRKAFSGFSDEEKSILFAKQNREAARIECSTYERGYVRRLIDAGRSLGNPIEFMYNRCRDSLDIVAKSPLRDRAAAKVKLFARWARTLHRDDDIVFATWSPKEPRDADHVRKLTDMIADVETGKIPTPVLISTNSYTGERAKTNTKLGYSLASKKTVNVSRNALLEFDSFDDVNDKFYFSAGLVASGEWPVVSCVYSGLKSVHVILRTQTVVDMFGAVDREETNRTFVDSWKKIERFFCSSPDPALRCDALCKDPTRMTRCAWAMRGMRRGGEGPIKFGENNFTNEPGSTSPQCLLYISEEGK